MTIDKPKPIGKTLVVGGGVAGIQASLDLSYGGFKVYLVESKDAIGGVMAQLDKTFPTNDCSMCILSPKLVEVGSNPNIELLTRARITKIEGEAPHFRVTVVSEPRFVDPALCKGCGDCAKECPVSFPNDYEEGLSQRRAIFRHYEQAVPSTFGIIKRDTPPCRAACPIHVNAQGYLQLIGKGKYREALALIREVNPFPNVTGRICTRPCEDACARAQVDESLAIDLLKRFVADLERQEGDCFRLEQPPQNGKKVAVIGAGPAGLLATYDLARKGYSVTVFERMPEAGGMLRYGIPAYRLPRDILAQDWRLLLDLGVEFRFGESIRGEEALNRLRMKYDAVFVATGAWRSRKMEIPGEATVGVEGAVEFLRRANENSERSFNGVAAVIGGGNAAIDASRMLLRLGAKGVHLIYRRTRSEMPANVEEIEEAEAEGVRIHLLESPTAIYQEGDRLVVTIQKMELGEADASGRPRPIPIPGSQTEEWFDRVVMAISQEPELENFPGLAARKGLLQADPLTLETNLPGVFAGGDAVLGPASFIEAMSHGRKAAVSIDRRLNHEDLRLGREKEASVRTEAAVETSGVAKIKRARPVLTLRRELTGDFSEINHGLLAENVPQEALRCLNCGGCSECMECVRICEAKAIVHEMTAKEQVIDVGSIILAAGFDETDATPYLSYGLGVFPNVVTSIQFERILSASGPFGGVITRPGDGRHPQKIAFLQCVGSRDKDHPFCSSVCCMYATKEAVIAREHSKEVETTLFYMDIRSFGKDFDRYVERAKAEYGIRFVRSRVAGLTQLMDGSLSLKYETEDGELVEEAFDLVVLSVGLDAPCDADHLAAVAGLRQDPYRFLEGGVFDPTATSRAGVFVAGALGGPKDIPESVTEGSAAAQQAAAIIADARGSEIQVKVLPPETDVRGQKPRVGVFVCHCGLNIGGFVDVKAVTDYTATLPYVVFSDSNLYTCSSDTQSRIKEKIAEHNLNRVVVASCTPRTHEPLFQETIREAGLNRFLFEMANIRDQNSWVHQNDRAGATQKAIDLVKAAVFKAADLTPLSVQLLPITRRGLVIGGGITGMTAALALADQGFETVLVEREPELGGNARFIHWMVEGQSVDAFLADLINKVRGHPRLRTKTGVRIETIEGYVGSYKTTLSDGEQIEHGVVVVTTGAVETPTTAYLYGQHPQVITQRELEERLFKGEIGQPKSAVFIQCVESRDEAHPYCSRICCQEAIKNSIRLKQGSPQTEVYVLYRDMRAYGMRELSYQRARELGVIFLPYDPERKPEVTANGRLTVRAHDRVLHRDLIFHPDLLVLGTGISPQADNETLAKLLKVPLTQDRFFLEAHVKLRPVEFATDGVFLAGMAHSPRSIEESIVQAQAAGGRAAMILAKEGIEAGGKVATVTDRNCAGCGVCESICAYSAVEVVEKKVLGQMKRVAEVNATLCKGCGACSGGCRSNAIDLEGFTNEEIVDAVEALLQPI